MAGQAINRPPSDAGFLERVLALRGHTQGRGIGRKLLDAYILGPTVGSACCQALESPGTRFAQLLRQAEGPVHWIRPGGIGDWATLAPYIEGTRRIRSHPEDTLWVLPAVAPFASAYHEGSDLQVRVAGLKGFVQSASPQMVLQLEPFHPTAWIWAALLRPRWTVGYPLAAPRNLEGPVVRPVEQDLAGFHPGVAPVRSQSVVGERKGVLIFTEGNHKSRGLPPGFLEGAASLGWADVVWFGQCPGPIPSGWRISQDYWAPKDLLDSIRSARLVIAPDSGPFHLARLLGTPVVGYFTSGEVGRWGWAAPGSRVVTSGFECTGCTVMALPTPCPFGYACRSASDVSAILEASASLLSER